MYILRREQRQVKEIGTLAENLLNNLVSDERIYSSVEKARSVTHLEQVHLAQEFQKRSLAELGITICDGKVCFTYREFHVKSTSHFTTINKSVRKLVSIKD